MKIKKKEIESMLVTVEGKENKERKTKFP